MRDQGNAAATRFGWGSRVPLATRVLPPLKTGKSSEPLVCSLVSIDVPGVVVVDTKAVAPGEVTLHLREVAGQTTTLDVGTVITWANLEGASEVNAIGATIQDNIESVELKPYDVRFVRLRFARPEN